MITFTPEGIINLIFLATLCTLLALDIRQHRKVMRTIREHGTYYGKLGTFLVKVPERGDKVGR